MSVEPRSQLPSIVRKPVETLSLVPTSGKVTVLGRKTWNVLLQLAQDQAVDGQEVYRATLSDVVAGIDFNSRNLAVIKGHLRSLMATTVEWQSPTAGEGERWDGCSMLAHAALENVRGQTWVEWSYAPNVRSELLNPNIFARLNLKMLSELRTIGGLALYEACYRYKAVGQTARRPWRWWAPVLLGRPDADLQQMDFRFFKRDTLRPAIAEINAVTDIEVDLLEFKQGRYVSDLQFTVKEKRRHTVRELTQPVNLALVARATALGIDQRKFERLLDTYGDELVDQALAHVERRKEVAFPDVLRDPYRFLKTILGNAGQPTVEAPLSAPVPEQIASEGLASSGPPLGPQDSKEDKQRRAWVEARRRTVAEQLEKLSAQAEAELVGALEQELIRSDTHPSIVKRLKQSGWRHQIVRHLMIDFYASQLLGPSWDQPTTVAIDQH
ncbi:replication initiation protein [Variovorax ginsengisoli]|uniref:Replication initiation protein n=1 Tax=Variovorax ginsengisoli TaxID=363844 RepID=A0ABT8SEY8_9BURK|nr:replication initiation protein [Variovorax ginsengisoli]MDN8618321.1 replication initiation protein [Variovorax ginsengisoli]MDO1537491.1 replication initiation protein [Variovorax ginsengisoli]